MSRKTGVCGKLYLSTRPKLGGSHEVEQAVGDVCGLPASHPGDHQGRWNGKRWARVGGTDYLTGSHPATQPRGDESRNPEPLRD